MKRTKYTIEDILALNPCPDWRARLPELMPRPLTARGIASRKDVDVVWRRWALTRLLYKADPRQLVLWACDCAALALENLADGDTRDAADCAIQTAVAWTEGSVDLSAAYSAARSAYSAADSADSADSAARSARSAARSAADSAAHSAASAAASAALSAADSAAHSAADALTLSWLVLRLESVS